MRYPNDPPQLFHEAVNDFIAALDVSIDRIAPFADLNPEQIRRLGKDGKHHTLTPPAIDKLVNASVLVGRPIAPELKDIWDKHLRVSSLYTALVGLAHRRTNSAWPQAAEDYAYVWKSASEMALYSKYTVYYIKPGAYQYRDRQGFPVDPIAVHERWAKNQLTDEEDMVALLNEMDKPK